MQTWHVKANEALLGKTYCKGHQQFCRMVKAEQVCLYPSTFQYCIKTWKWCEKPVNCSISHVFHTFFTGCETVETLWKGQFSQGQNPCKTLWKTLWVFTLWKNLWKTLWKTCELSHCFSHGRKCQNLWKGHFSQGQNPCKTLWKTLWVFTLWKNLWKTLWKPCELSQCFSQGRKCQNLWTGHFSQEQNLWKTLWNGC